MIRSLLLLPFFTITAFASPSVKLEIEKVHGQNCKTKADWLPIDSGQTLQFFGFSSQAQDQFRTACQVVSLLTPPDGHRVRLKVDDFGGKSVGEGSQMNVSISLLPALGRPTEVKLEPKQPGPYSWKGASQAQAQEILSDCGKPVKLLTKAAAFYRGKPQTEDISVDFVKLTVESEPCQRRH